MKWGAILLATGLLLLLAGAAWGASSVAYELSWYTVAGGGGTLAGDGYTLGGTAGQAAAGVMAADGYTLAGGYSAGGVVAPPPGQPIYLPLVMRSPS
jgi:hypothetical protein